MKDRIKIVTAMLIYGSIGVFVKNINLQPIEIAFFRAFVGSMFLLIVGLLMKEKYSIQSIKRNIIVLIISGSALGINWALLFKAYDYTSVSNATMVYYLAPVFVIILSPLVLKEKINPLKLICVLVAMGGLWLIITSHSNTLQNSNDFIKGISYSLLAAVFYSSVILMNKKIKNLSGFQTTVIQLIFALFILVTIMIYRGSIQIVKINSTSLTLIIILGVLHTGIAYLLYFSSMKKLKAQSIAIFCYIDPISALFFAAIFLRENLHFNEIVGGILILGSTMLSEKSKIINWRNVLNCYKRKNKC